MLLWFFATCVLIAILIAPLLVIEHMKGVFEDFKLKLPGPSELAIDMSDALLGIYTQYWIWIVPFVSPFLILRIPPPTRRKMTLPMMLLAVLVGILSIAAIVPPMMSLMEGMKSGPNRH